MPSRAIAFICCASLVAVLLLTGGCDKPTVDSLKRTRQNYLQQLDIAKRAYESKDSLGYVNAMLKAQRAEVSLREDAETLLERGELFPDEAIEYMVFPGGGGLIGALTNSPPHQTDPEWEATCRSKHRDLWLDLMYGR